MYRILFENTGPEVVTQVSTIKIQISDSIGITTEVIYPHQVISSRSINVSHMYSTLIHHAVDLSRAIQLLLFFLEKFQNIISRTEK